MNMKKSYFMRIFYWENDEEEKAPVYIKIPVSILSPSTSMLMLLTALESFYGVECYLAISEIYEASDTEIGLVPFGVATDKAMLVAADLSDGAQHRQYLCGVTCSTGEYELLAIDQTGDFVVLVVDQNLIDYLGLIYVEEVTLLHKMYLADLGYGEDEESIYFPTVLYD